MGQFRGTEGLRRERCVKTQGTVEGGDRRPGSRQLVPALIASDLVNELRLMVYPFVLGAGERLVGQANDKAPPRLVANGTVGDSLA